MGNTQPVVLFAIIQIIEQFFQVSIAYMNKFRRIKIWIGNLKLLFQRLCVADHESGLFNNHSFKPSLDLLDKTKTATMVGIVHPRVSEIGDPRDARQP